MFFVSSDHFLLLIVHALMIQMLSHYVYLIMFKLNNVIGVANVTLVMSAFDVNLEFQRNDISPE